MREIFKWSFFLAAVCCMTTSCGSGDSEGGGPTPPPTPDPNALNITPIEKLNQGASQVNSHKDVLSRSSLKMDFRSYIELKENLLGVAQPCYARIKRMKNGNFIMFYEENEHGGNIHYAISSNLKVWQHKGKLLSIVTDAIDPLTSTVYWRHFACPDAVVLKNGEILVVAQYRPGANYRTRGHINGLVVMRSKDNGITWSAPTEIYQGVNWEPCLLELSSGEIHCYFTDSSRTEIVAKDTGTALVVSKDGGNTWTPGYGNDPYLVIRSKYTNGRVREEYIPIYGEAITAYNDQMPVVIQLNNSKELAAVMETARPYSDYDITFAYSGEDGEWEHLAADQKGPEDREEKLFNGAGPYMAQFPSGETVMTYGHAYNGTFYMRMGDARARNFGSPQTVFTGAGYWGSILVADAHRLITTFPNVKGGYVRLAQFFLNHDIAAATRTVTVDGANTEWTTTDDALFVGAKSQAQATLRCSADNNNVYFLVEVLDRVIDDEDYATLYLSPASSGSLTKDQSCRIKLSYNGLVSSDLFDSGTNWKSSDMGITVKTKYLKRDTDKAGYVAEISIPRSKLDIQSGKILTNFALYDKVGGEDNIVSTSSASTTKWMLINGL